MSGQAYRIILVCGLLGSFFCAAAAMGGETRFSTTGISRGRAIAMGGAYHSVVDDFSAMWYNPSALRVNKTREERNLRLFFNPLGMAVGLADYARFDRDMVRDDELTPGEGALALLSLFRGAVYTTPMVDFGLSLGEEMLSADPARVETHRFFSAREQSLGSMYAASANVKIASTVSIGLSGALYYSRVNGEAVTGSGYTFGVLLNPNRRLNVGIAYHDLADEMPEARFPMETIADGTVVGGISYYPDEDITFSIDLRNLNKDDKRSSREIHAGLERVFGNRVALRAGYFRKNETDNDVLSVGFGLLPFWDRISRYRNSARSDILTYTWIIDKNGERSDWHLFSLMLRY